MDRIKTLFCISVVFLLLSACQVNGGDNINLPVERESHGFKYYETTSAEEALDQISFSVRDPQNLPFELGQAEGSLFESMENPGHQGISLKYFPKGSDIERRRGEPLTGVREFIEYRVTNFEFNMEQIKNDSNFEKLKFGKQSVYFRYSKEMIAAVVHWEDEGREYQLSYGKAYQSDLISEEESKKLLKGIYQSL